MFMPTGAGVERAAVGQNAIVLPGEVSTKGRLLLATPPLGDPNFDRTVVFVLDHSSEGAVGVVLNRPSGELDIDGLEDWRPLMSQPQEVFSGGPVEEDSLIALGTAQGRNPDAWGDLDGGLGTVDLSLHPVETADRIERLRLFRGYAGWGGGQLDAEISVGAWMVFDATEDDIFSERPQELWRDVLRRQGGRVAWVANAPDDLSLN